MSTLFKGSTGTDDSGAWMYEKDMLVSPSRDGAGKSGASGSVDWAKISFAARSRLGRREERIVLTALVLLFGVPGVVEVFVIQWYCEGDRVMGASGSAAGGVTLVVAKF